MTAPEVQGGVLQALHGRVTVGWCIKVDDYRYDGPFRNRFVAERALRSIEYGQAPGARIVRLYRRVRWVP